MKQKRYTPRDLHKLKIIKREARGDTRTIASKKIYRRKPKHVPAHSLRYC